MATPRKPARPAVVPNEGIGGPSTSPTTGALGNTALAAFVRNNAQFIVSGCLTLASQAGQERNWQDMQEYQAIAGQLSHYCGLDLAPPQQAQAITRSAGA